MSLVMKKRKAKAVQFSVAGGGKVLQKIWLNVTLSSMYDVMDCLRQTEKEFVRNYNIDVVQWDYRILKDEELKQLNIGG